VKFVSVLFVSFRQILLQAFGLTNAGYRTFHSAPRPIQNHVQHSSSSNTLPTTIAMTATLEDLSVTSETGVMRPPIDLAWMGVASQVSRYV
jgi:hypothetical protein